jgi:hypothetical protein
LLENRRAPAQELAGAAENAFFRANRHCDATFRRGSTSTRRAARFADHGRDVLRRVQVTLSSKTGARRRKTLRRRRKTPLFEQIVTRPFKGANFEAGVKGLPALGGTSAPSKKSSKINYGRLRFFLQLLFRVALDLENAPHRALLDLEH